MITAYDIHRWLLEAVKLRARTNTNPKVIHVSEVANCLRRSYYLRTKTLQLSPVNALRLLGDEVHKSLQEVLKGLGYEVEYPVAIIANGIRLVGRIDAYNPRGKYLVEFKTVSKIPETPYPNHLLQTQAYIAMTGSRKGYIAYISRDDGRVGVFRVRPKKGVLRKLILRARELSDSLIRNKPPKPELSPLCNQCEFRFYCFRGHEDGKH